MNLVEELNKLKPYIGTDTAKFREQADFIYKNVQTEKEKQMVTDFIKSALTASTQELDATIEAVRIKLLVTENSDILPLAYIAKKYFNKTKTWLYQRINGHTVNGKPARFTKEELGTFQDAIKDISHKLGSIDIVQY
ncbi:MAG: DUF5053 domain-containing protein [Prevotella sp.]|jgi:hypothetical protein|nr:DUF5053 domain-containing protein [Prevotella sp.]